MANKRYIIIANYTQKAMAGFVRAPSDRAAAVKEICKAVGVEFVSLDLVRGAYDVVVVLESDSFDRVAGVKMAVLASGTVTDFHILEPIDWGAVQKHAAAVAKVYKPAG